jgi:glutamine amidotransferase
MCELFGLSSDRPVAASRELDTFRLRGGSKADNPDGWGIAWLTNGVFSLVKEPNPAHRSALFEQLCDTTRSNLVIAHVRKASYPTVIDMSNTHPFHRVCCGREWVFAHNGMVPDIVEMEMSSHNPVCCPTGRTDSEYAFCHLLGRIAEHFNALPSTAPPTWLENLATASGLIASLGKFNFLMSDGEHLIAYGHDRLHYLEHPSASPTDGGVGHRVLIATEPLDENVAWIAFQPGELRFYRAGKMIGQKMPQPKPVADSLRH